MISTTIQAGGAPIVDRCTTFRFGAFEQVAPDRSYDGRAILLKPWRRGERSQGARALVIGWQR
jgi:hypothetical protein